MSFGISWKRAGGISKELTVADWAGGFGDEYTERNMAVMDRRKFFSKFMHYEIRNAFEIGCNWGANLMALETLDVHAMGCDINQSAVDTATDLGLTAVLNDGTGCWEFSNEFDFVFTVGVLIHQRTPDLISMMKEMVRLSSEFVMFAEYLGDDEEVPYRGERFALFKRDYGKVFEALFPNAQLMEQGTAGKELGLDDITYWVYDISNCASAVRVEQTSRQSFNASEETEPISSFVGQIGKVGVT